LIKLSYWSVLLLFVTSQGVHANMRGPVFKSEGSSSSLYFKADVKVQREELTFDCGRQFCKVKAAYWLDAKNAFSTELSFITPNEVGVKAQVNQQVVESNTKPLQITRTQERRLQKEFPNNADDLRKLHQASFPAQLNAGENQVEVEYSQPLYEFEADYGYFKKSRFLSAMRYEVWPLQEWKLAEDFTLTVQATFQPQVKPNFLERSLGTIEIIRCFDDRQDSPLPMDQRKTPYSQQATFIGAKLPNRLVCLMGDDDLVDLQRAQDNQLFFFYNRD
jgi:hypothetical protein